MSVEYTIPLTKIEQEFNLTRVTVPENYEEIKVETPEVNRPGLALTGFYEIFERSRISIIGNAEHLYLRRLDPDDRKKKITDYVNARPVAVIFAHGLEVFEELTEEASEIELDEETTIPEETIDPNAPTIPEGEQPDDGAVG